MVLPFPGFLYREQAVCCSSLPKKNPSLIVAEMGFWILLRSAKRQPATPSCAGSHHQLLIV
jgi:hypothetical protein